MGKKRERSVRPVVRNIGNINGGCPHMPHFAKNPMLTPPAFEENTLVQPAIFAYDHAEYPTRCCYIPTEPNFGNCKEKCVKYNFSRCGC